MDAPKSHPQRTDYRLYVPHPDVWAGRVKTSWEKEYCYMKNPGEEYFHLLLNGELYLQRGDEKLCLNCALRQGYLTMDRLNWQHRTPRERGGIV